jgi:tetratricopeptide (TPR) repeat protein
MRSRKLFIAFGLLAAMAPLAPASAQPAAGGGYPAACPSVPPAKSEEAHAFYSAGRAFYDEGNYDAAITQFREAYKRDCSKHDLLVIISRSYELKGDRAEAVRALEVFLERMKDSPDAGTHRAKIDNLKKQIAAQPPPAPLPLPLPLPTPAEVREHTIPPWIVVGVGGAAIVAGVVILATAPTFPEDCDKATKTCERINGESEAAFKDRQDRAGGSQNQPTIGAVVIGGGLVLVAGGLLWHFLEPTGPAPVTASFKPKVKPDLAPGYAGLSLGGTL